MKSKLWLWLTFALAVRLSAQITIVDSGAIGNQVNLNGTYTQNFDGLLASTPPGGTPWINNVTIPGWYSSQSQYSANSTAFGLSSFGSGNATERALGSTGASWAVRFVNNSSQTITGFTVSYMGEQWYRGANDPQNTDRMFFDYLKYSASVPEAQEIENIGGFGRVDVPELRFFAPNQTDPTASVLDGNAAENRYIVTYSLTGISLAPGEKIWFRWNTGDTANFNDHALSTDDVAISFSTAIPEPASYASLAAGLVLAFVALRRPRRD